MARLFLLIWQSFLLDTSLFVKLKASAQCTVYVAYVGLRNLKHSMELLTFGAMLYAYTIRLYYLMDHQNIPRN